MTRTGKAQLGCVAYTTAREQEPGFWWLPWEALGPEQQDIWAAIAVSVRGFHPDA